MRSSNLSLLMGLLVSPFLLAGCGNTLIFAERSGVNISAKVDAASSLPIEANAGVKRQVFTAIPPSGSVAAGDTAVARGEAVNMFAQFDIDREQGTGELSDTVKIRNRFATGAAAYEISGEPKAVKAVIQPFGVRAAMAEDIAAKLDGCSNDQLTAIWNAAFANETAFPTIHQALIARSSPATGDTTDMRRIAQAIETTGVQCR